MLTDINLGIKEKNRHIRRALKLMSYLVERETGLEPATTCLEGHATAEPCF